VRDGSGEGYIRCVVVLPGAHTISVLAMTKAAGQVLALLASIMTASWVTVITNRWSRRLTA
jgi:hypothetical protein